MADDWDDYMDEGYEEEDSFPDLELTPEDIAELKRRQQDANMGFTYGYVEIDGKFGFRCNKCGRVAGGYEKPFPHKFNCPMKRDAKKE